MIDFRYHLVSIVSIFMALAVGIVLGAGPLKGQIGDTLSAEVTALRDDRAALRTELEAARKAGVARDEFTADTRNRLVGGTLTGATVAMVVLPGADADHVTAVNDTLTAAGAAVVSRTTIEDAWVPEGATAIAAQAKLASELRRSLALPAAASSDSAPLDEVLAVSLVSAEASAVTDAGKAALDALAGANLVGGDTADVRRASNVIVVGGLLKGDVVTDRDRRASRLAGLAVALDRAGRGAVLASDVGVSGFANASSVVRAARGDAGTARNLSTVDDVSLPLGQVSVAYALVQQNAGGVGQYGLGDGVSAAYPPVPATP